MMRLARRDPIDTLADLLRDQRAALRAGRLDDLAALVPRMDRALDALGRNGDHRRLERLRGEAAETAALIRAAQAGLARARALT